MGKDSEDAAARVTGWLYAALDASDYQVVRKSLDAAIDCLDAVPAERRRDLELSVWTQYAVLADIYGDAERAIEYNQRIARAKPDDSVSFLALGRLFREQGRGQEAADAWGRCRDLAEQQGLSGLLDLLDAKSRNDSEGGTFSRSETLTYSGLADLLREQAEARHGATRILWLRETARLYRLALDASDASTPPDDTAAIRGRLADVERLLSST